MNSIDNMIDSSYEILRYMYDLHVVLKDGTLFFPFSATDISEHFNKSRTTIFNQLIRLKQAELIESSSKKRRYNITSKGAILVKNIEKTRKEMEESDKK